MRYLVRVFVGLIFLAHAQMAHADNLRFERILSDTGMSVAEANAVVQDALGYIWVGGGNGLVRYDGHAFEKFVHDPQKLGSLSHNFIWDLLVDTKGRMWVATPDGLNRFIPETQTFHRYRHSSHSATSLTHNDVFTLMEDRQGYLWVGTRKGLGRMDTETGQFKSFYANENQAGTMDDNDIRSVFQDKQGNVWVGTVKGLNLYDDRHQNFQPVCGAANTFGLPTCNNVTGMVEDQQYLWIGTQAGLLRYDRQQKNTKIYVHNDNDPFSISDDRIKDLMIDSQNQLWVTTDGGGLNVFDIKKEQFNHYRHDPTEMTSLGNNKVRKILEDESGDFWITLFSGLDYADHTTNDFKVFKQEHAAPTSLLNNGINVVAQGPDKQVWVGSEGGLDLLNLATGRALHFTHDAQRETSLGANPVLSIAQDHQGQYWFGTWSGGLNLFNTATGDFTRFIPDSKNPNSISSAYIWSLLVDRDGLLWIGTEANNLDVYNPKTQTFKHFVPDANDPKALSGSYMRALLQDHQGTIWVGTINGLNRFNATTDTFTRFQHQNDESASLPNNMVLCLFEDSKHRLWVGTNTGLALAHNRNQGGFKTFTSQQGFTNDAVTGIIEDAEGRLWINTENGLYSFDVENNLFERYSRQNGLAGHIMNRSALLRLPNDDLLVGSTTGLSQFSPNRLAQNPRPPPVVLTDFRIFNQSVVVGEQSKLKQNIQYTQEVFLSYQDAMFSIHFSGLNYRNSTANQYAYQLEGFDAQWINAGNSHSATYTNLNPGTYVFKVKASNNKSIWNEAGRSLVIHVSPPPWRTWWAYLAYVFILGGVVFAYIRSQRLKIEFEREKNVQLRKIDKLRDEFLANTSHELRTPLNGIIGLSESLIDNQSEVMSDKVRGYLKMIAGSGRRLSNLVNDILDFSKLKNNGLDLQLKSIDVAHLVDLVCSMSKPLADKKTIELINEVPADLPPVWGDGNRLQQILYNLIGNAIKFTFFGKVRVYATVEEGGITLYIEDSGIGIPESDLGSIFESFTQVHGEESRQFEGTGLGLAVAKNLVELHGGTIGVKSEINKGSLFYITLKQSHQPAVDLLEDDAEAIQSVVDMNASAEHEEVVTTSPNVYDHKFHLLVVDDDPINRQVLLGQLSLHEYKITEATNGQEALSLLEMDHSIDLVLLDVMMPRMTGYEVAAKMRMLRPVHELPIIFITAKHLASDLVAGFTAGGNDFLIKPVSKNELLSRTKTHLMLLDITRNLEKIVEERTQKLKETQRSLERVDNIVHNINRQANIEGLAGMLLRESAKLVGDNILGGFWLLHDQSSNYQLVVTHGAHEITQQLPIVVPLSLIEASIKDGRLIPGIQKVMPGRIELIAHLDPFLDCAILLSIQDQNQIAALMLLVKPRGAGEFTQEQIEWVSRLDPHALSAVTKARLLETLQHQNKALEDISYKDALTQLHNRRYFISHLNHDLESSIRRHREADLRQTKNSDNDLLFILVDIDHFKPVNDGYGHNAGDLILKQFAALLRGAFRESDHIIRWGGEEFLVVVRFIEREQGAALIERFRQSVASTIFDIGEGKTLKITCSIGFASYPFYRAMPEAYTWEQVVELADQSLYAAKKSSRNVWVGLFGSDAMAQPPAFSLLDHDLANAVAAGRVVLKTNIASDKSLTWN